MSKEAVLLIHGFGNNNRVWDAYRDMFLKRNFRVLAPNLRHHAPGDNLDGFEKVSLTDYVNDLELLIKNLGFQPIIIGYSMGGLLALKLMERGYGKLGICLAPAAPAGVNAISLSVLRLFLRNLLVWRFWKKVHKPRFSAARFGALGHLPIKEAQQIFELISSSESGRVGVEIGFPIFDPKKASSFNEKKIKCPVLVIGAKRDRVTPITIARQVARKTAHVSDYIEYPKFGHWLMSGYEFEVVSSDCLKWIASKLDK